MKTVGAKIKDEALLVVKPNCDAMAREIDKYEKTISTLKKEKEALINSNLQLAKEYELLHRKYQIEKTTVIKPAYRNLYQACGGLLRRMVPSSIFEAIKRIVPNPNGVSYRLTGQAFLNKNEIESTINFSEPDVSSKPDVFILSIINWRYRYQRPQHLAKGLSESGRRVFYVEMDRATRPLELETLSDKLFRVRFSYKGDKHVKNYTGKAEPEAAHNWIQSFYAFCDAVKSTTFKQIVVQHPFWWQFVKHLPPEFEIIYDCMDDISGFPDTSKFVLDLEEEMLGNCDKLVVSSKKLADKYRDYREPWLIRNAADTDHFNEKLGETGPVYLNDKLIRSERGQKEIIKVGYVGAIAEWFDHDLIENVAREMTKAEFHICGAVTADSPARLDDLSNIKMYGEISYEDVPRFIFSMDVMIIPFKILPIIIACDPVKYYEYSAMGKPTVSTALPELSRAGDKVLIASSPEEFAKNIVLASRLAEDADYCGRLKEYAAKNTWDDRVKQFVEVLEDFPKVSIIILSYGDPRLTNQSISSLYDGGAAYPNMEVIVVDNGSGEEQIDKIRSHIADTDGICLIENKQNLGFARGNNVGLKAATGEFVMLLNNDTYVAPGAILSMVRHLQLSPKIGAVGPLTNNIGNEAKLNLAYTNMTVMKKIVRNITVGYRGHFTPLDVLAYFAVMFRRSDLDDFGLLSEDYGLGMFEDDDHCKIIKSSGYVCALAEDAFVHHELSGSFSRIKKQEGKALFEKNKKIFEEKWGPWVPHTTRSRRPASSLQTGR